MKTDDIRLGMKVVPFQKTAERWGDLNSSKVWKKARNTQGFLYVFSLDREEDAWVLSEEKDNLDGDFFRSEDFELYEKINPIIRERIKKSAKHIREKMKEGYIYGEPFDEDDADMVIVMAYAIGFNDRAPDEKDLPIYGEKE